MSHSRDNLLPANIWPVAPIPESKVTETVEETIIHRTSKTVIETYVPPKKRRKSKSKKTRKKK